MVVPIVPRLAFYQRFVLEQDYYSTANASGSMLFGWEAFFEEVCSLLRSAERQEGVANMAFSPYIVERLQICISSVSLIREQLINPPDTVELSDSDREVSQLNLTFAAP